MSSEEKKHEGVLTIDRAAFLLLRVKKAFKKKKQQRKDKSVVGPGPVVPEVKPVGPNRPPPLLRSRTLPAIVVPGLSILQAQIDARYRQDGEAGTKEKCKTPSRLQAPSIAFTDDSLAASQHFSLHRHSSPEPPPGVVDAVLRLPSPHVVAARAYRMSAPSPGASTTALYRLAKLLNQRGSTSASSTGVASGDGTRRLSWERRETCHLPRSSSIDSVVEAAGGWGSSSGESTPAPPPRRLPSPLLQRPERPLTLVSPSVGRRMKGHRAVSALFAAVEHGHVDRARTILESTDVDVNSVNSDGLSPLDVAVLNNNRQLAKMLAAFGAQEGNQFKSPESLGTHLKQLLGEAERKVQELGGGLLPVDESSPVNHNNNRASFSIIGSHHSVAASAMTGCSGGGDAATDKQLMLWERRAKGLKKMLLGFDQARPPDVPFLVAVDVTGTNSVTVRFQEPEQQDSAICTKFKVQWSLNDNFSPLAGEKEILDMKHLEYQVTDLQQGHRYFFRVAAGNLKGYGQFRPSTPTSVMPSSWRDMEGREPRYAGRLQLLDDLFDEIRSSRPEHASEIKASLQLGETPGVQRRNQKKKTTIKQLFTVASKFQKNLRRGVFLACLLYHEDKVLVTNEDFLPVIEVDETYPSCIYNDFHWLMKVACTWDDVKSLRQDMEKSLSSSAVHFRIKLLQAAAQMQTALCIQDLGQLYHRPIRDSQGTLVISTVNYVRSPKTVSVLNSRWIPLSKVQKKLIAHEELNVGDLLMSSIQEQITYHQVSSIRLNRGLYLGYLKMRSSVDLIQVVVPCKTPNVLPHCKIRDNPHVSSEEWEWLKWQAARHKPLTDESCTSEEEVGADQQRVFVELVAATARRLFSYMEVSNQDALAHRLYNTEVVDLSPEVSFLIIVPPAESACAAPGQADLLLQRGDLVSLPVQVFEMVHLGTYQRDVISRYSRLSCILELDTVLAHHSHREAFSSSEVAAAKDRLSQLQEFQGQLNSTWKGVRWLMDVLTFARDRTVTTPGVSMKQLLSLTTTTDKSASSSLKRSLLQLPPRDPKLVKSSASRGSWPGPGAHPGGVACLLGAELSKSEQHLSGRGGSRKNSGGGSSVGSGTSQYQGHSDMSGATSTALMTTSASNGSLSSADVASRLPPSRSEDTLLQRPHTKCHARSRSSTLSPLMSVRGAGGPSYPPASMVSVTPNTSASMHSLSSDESSSAAAPLSATEEREDVSVPTPTSGILQVYAAYETGLASGTSLKLHVTPRTTAREVVDLVVKQLNMAVILKGKDGPMYSSDKLANFCLVAIIGARERCLRDDFKPLQLQDPWKKGRLYVRQKQDKLAALERCSRHTAYL